jgi:hypothetical protein
MRRRLLLTWAVAAALVCAAQAPARPESPPRRVVFVADGAGDYRSCSQSMRSTACADGLPLEVVTFVWSHGYRRLAADQTDTAHACRKGDELAWVIRTLLRGDPAAQVSLAGHCAGGQVVLEAARRLPPDSLHAVVLLSASMSDGYDVRPVLRAARAGLHNFYSSRDRYGLGIATWLVGTSDSPLATRAAGRYGFRSAGCDPFEAGRLHQYPWRPDYAGLGHDGGHHGCYAPDHLRAFVFPILMAD